MNRSSLIVALCLLVVAACGSSEAPRLPPLTDVAPVGGLTRGPANLRGQKLRALYIVPHKLSDGSRLGISSGDRQREIVEMIAILADSGELFINDVVHGSPSVVHTYGKIDLRAITLSSPQGAFTSKRRLFTPTIDPLAALDTGYEIEVQAYGVKNRVVLPPIYESNRHSPFGVAGEVGAAGKIGVSPGGPFTVSKAEDGDDGRTGLAGEDGESGKNGEKPGENGQGGGDGGDGGDARDGDGTPGGRGGRGGNGGSGRGGSNGGNGASARPGDPGPEIFVEARPIYSKFYPDEELVFLKVTAQFYRRNGRRPYRSATQNYVFHRGQRFTVTSRGGDGGAGGAGGAGGHGGLGGNGGDGGDGGDGGNGRSGGTQAAGQAGGAGADGGKGGFGGNGARGGKAGNGGRGAAGGRGGDIRAQLAGSSSFQAAVRRSIRLQSVGGRGGAAGRAGNGGNGGRGGRAGKGGKKGKGGRGGSGRPTGANGKDGRDGKDGESGDSGKRGRNGKPGRPGANGRAGRTAW